MVEATGRGGYDKVPHAESWEYRSGAGRDNAHDATAGQDLDMVVTRLGYMIKQIHEETSMQNTMLQKINIILTEQLHILMSFY